MENLVNLEEFSFKEFVFLVVGVSFEIVVKTSQFVQTVVVYTELFKSLEYRLGICRNDPARELFLKVFDLIQKLHSSFAEVDFQRSVLLVSQQEGNLQLLHLLHLDVPGPLVEDLLLVARQLAVELLVLLKDELGPLAVANGMVEVFEALGENSVKFPLHNE